MVTKDKTKPTLLARKNYRGNKLRLEVKIALNDDCNNGHADFSITASGYEYDRGRWRDSFGGCCHDEILKRSGILERIRSC